VPEAVIIDAVWTPIGALGGGLSTVRPDDLAAVALESIFERTGIDPGIVEAVYLGCANQAGEDNRNVARILTTLLHEMGRRASEEEQPYYGLATLCVGVGQGEATIVEWIEDVA
jgi:acetyl-CoA acetyltransferase